MGRRPGHVFSLSYSEPLMVYCVLEAKIRDPLQSDSYLSLVY